MHMFLYVRIQVKIYGILHELKKHEGVKGAVNEAEKLLNILVCISLLSGIRKTIGKDI